MNPNNLYDFLVETNLFISNIIAQHERQVTLIEYGREQFKYWADPSMQESNESKIIALMTAFDRYAVYDDFGVYFPDFHFFAFGNEHKLPFGVSAIPLGKNNMVYLPIDTNGNNRACDTLTMNDLFAFYYEDLKHLRNLLLVDHFTKEEFLHTPSYVTHLSNIISLPLICANSTNTTHIMKGKAV